MTWTGEIFFERVLPKPPKGKIWVNGELHKRHTGTQRAGDVPPIHWWVMGKNAKEAARELTLGGIDVKEFVKECDAKGVGFAGGVAKEVVKEWAAEKVAAKKLAKEVTARRVAAKEFVKEIAAEKVVAEELAKKVAARRVTT